MKNKWYSTSWVVRQSQRIVDRLSSWMLFQVMKRYFLEKELKITKTIRKKKWKITHTHVEIYVLVSFVSLVFSLAILPIFQIPWWIWWLLWPGWYVVIRPLDIVTYQVRVFVLSTKNTLRGYRRSTILLFFNYLEILICFALFYQRHSPFFEGEHLCPNSFLGSMYFSLVTMSTLGYGDIVPQNSWGVVSVFTQTLMGIFLAILMFARLVSLLPKPMTLDPAERGQEKPKGFLL